DEGDVALPTHAVRAQRSCGHDRAQRRHHIWREVRGRLPRPAATHVRAGLLDAVLERRGTGGVGRGRARQSGAHETFPPPGLPRRTPRTVLFAMRPGSLAASTARPTRRIT